MSYAGWTGAVVLGVAALALILGMGALAMNRVPLTETPGLGARLGTYLTQNHAQTREAHPFPELRPPHLEDAPADAVDRVRGAMQELGWESVRVAGMRITAEVVTPLLGFRDDVRVEVQPTEYGGTRIHIRSASRVGRADFGANLSHILELIAALEARRAS